MDYSEAVSEMCEQGRRMLYLVQQEKEEEGDRSSDIPPGQLTASFYTVRTND